MLCSKPSIPPTTVSLVALSVFLHAAFGAHPLVVLWHECFNELEYPSNGAFDVNLRELLRDFIDLVPEVGHADCVKGVYRSQSNGLVFGMAQCWSKIEPGLCRECITKAFQELRTSRCPNKLGAIIWYEDCLVKYSNTSFLHTSDINNGFYLTNDTLVGTSPNYRVIRPKSFQ